MEFSIHAVFRAFDRFTAPVRVMEGQVGRLTRGIKALTSASKAVDRVHAGLSKAGKVVAASGIAAGAAALHFGRAGADFEQAISSVGAVSLQSRGEIRELEKEALRLGATTQFTATQAANAMELMARAGFSNAEILSGVQGVLDAAAASGLEMAEVANHVSNVLKGMGLEASEAGRVADVLSLASSRTNSSIGSLGESMKNLAPVAKQFGIGLEDAVGMVALLQDVGLDASEAGTATATMLTKLSSPVDSVAKQMKKLGIVFEDSAGNMLPPLQIFENMQAASERLGGNMDQVAFFADLVGLRGQKAALNLKELFTSDKGQRLTGELNEALGVSKQMAELRMDNLLGDITILGSAIDGVKIALFNTQNGPLRKVVQETTAWVNANSELIESKFVSYLGTVRNNLDSIVVWTKRVAIAIAVFYSIALAVKVARVAMIAFRTAVIVSAFVVRQLRIALIAGQLAFWVFSGSTIGATYATHGFAAATKAAGLALLPFLKILGLIAAAIAAVLIAMDQWKKLMNEIGGLESFKAGAWSFIKGEGFFKGMDEHLNEEARRRAAGQQARHAATGPAAPEIGVIGTEKWMEGLDRFKEEFDRELEETSVAGGSAFSRSIIEGMPAIQAELDRLEMPRFIVEHMARDISPETHSPHMRAATEQTRHLEERRTEARVVIQDDTGRAIVAQPPPKRGGLSLSLQPSGGL